MIYFELNFPDNLNKIHVWASQTDLVYKQSYLLKNHVPIKLEFKGNCYSQYKLKPDQNFADL